MTEVADPVTRFNNADADEGWATLTVDPAPMEKLFQSMTALGLDCVMVRVLAGPGVMLARPAVTRPPVGKLWAEAPAVRVMRAATATTDRQNQRLRFAPSGRVAASLRLWAAFSVPAPPLASSGVLIMEGSELG
jgi:hypothetical protein